MDLAHALLRILGGAATLPQGVQPPFPTAQTESSSNIFSSPATSTTSLLQATSQLADDLADELTAIALSIPLPTTPPEASFTYKTENEDEAKALRELLRSDPRWPILRDLACIGLSFTSLLDACDALRVDPHATKFARACCIAGDALVDAYLARVVEVEAYALRRRGDVSLARVKTLLADEARALPEASSFLVEELDKLESKSPSALVERLARQAKYATKPARELFFHPAERLCA